MAKTKADYGIDPKVIGRLAREINEIATLGVQVGVVIGGGNIFRGAGLAGAGMDRVTGDHMGMLATVMNGLALQDALERLGAHARVMSAIRINEVCEDFIRRRAVRHLEKGRICIFAAGTGNPFFTQDALERLGVITRAQTAIEMRAVAEPYIRRRAIRHLEKGRVVIFAGGTGNPYFTTDTAGALRAMEIDADIVVKATKVDGVYSADPLKHPDAERYARLSFDRVINEKLAVMDATAMVMCRDHELALRVFNMNEPGALKRLVSGEDIGTLVAND